MKQTFVINALARDDKGKGASRRLRHADKVPGIVYGAGKEPTSIVVEHNALSKLLTHEAFYTQILDLDISGNKEQVILRDLQRHPFKPRITHLDLQRISATEKIIMRIPLHFVGGDIAPGVKLGGCSISHLMSDTEVRCLPKDLPEFIEVDLSKLGINQTVHLSDLKLSSAIEILSLTHGEDKPLATAYTPRTATEEEGASVVAASAVPSAADDKKKAAEEEGKTGDAKGKDKSSEKKGKK